MTEVFKDGGAIDLEFSSGVGEFLSSSDEDSVYDGLSPEVQDCVEPGRSNARLPALGRGGEQFDDDKTFYHVGGFRESREAHAAELGRIRERELLARRDKQDNANSNSNDARDLYLEDMEGSDEMCVRHVDRLDENNNGSSQDSKYSKGWVASSSRGGVVYIGDDSQGSTPGLGRTQPRRGEGYVPVIKDVKERELGSSRRDDSFVDELEERFVVCNKRSSSSCCIIM